MNSINSTDIVVAPSPGADVNGVTLILLCQLFGFVKEWQQAGGVSVSNDKAYDRDQSVEKEIMFSDADCQRYSDVLTRYNSDDCASNSMVYGYDVGRWSKGMYWFSSCLTYRFMTEMGANSSCTNNSVTSANYTNVQNPMSLSAKDRLFHSFMAEKLNLTSICRSSNDTLTVDMDTNRTIFSYDNCDYYYVYQSNNGYKNNIVCHASDREDHYEECLFYRLMKNLGADSICSEMHPQFKRCDLYKHVMRGVVSSITCINGLIGNLIFLSMFCHGGIEIPTAYQLQWLAGVDLTFIVTYWLVVALPSVMSYANVTSDLYWHGIDPVLRVCLIPVFRVSRCCTVWITVFIGVYRYLAVCKPYSNVCSHVRLHGHKYVKLIVILCFVYSFPWFLLYHLESFEEDGQVYLRDRGTDLLSHQFYVVYNNYIGGALITCLPLIILSFVTARILMELRKKKKKRSNMQSSSTPQDSITAALVTILITFIICQSPFFLYFAILINIPSFDSWTTCGSFLFYFREFADLGLLLHSSANGFIYFFMNKTFLFTLPLLKK